MDRTDPAFQGEDPFVSCLAGERLERELHLFLWEGLLRDSPALPRALRLPCIARCPCYLAYPMVCCSDPGTEESPHRRRPCASPSCLRPHLCRLLLKQLGQGRTLLTKALVHRRPQGATVNRSTPTRSVGWGAARSDTHRCGSRAGGPSPATARGSGKPTYCCTGSPITQA